MATLHTDREYENQLKQLRENILNMAGHVELMINNSIQALTTRDTELAQETIDEDCVINSLEVETDQLCLLILAKRQPMASDLRFITLALKMVTDLERIGDLAVNISERVRYLAAVPALGEYKDIPRMAELAKSMVHDAIDAFIENDVRKAREVIARDDEIDELYTAVFRDVLLIMKSDTTTLKRGIDTQSVAKWLERIGDHATNICEQVIFMVKGKDIRHEGKRDNN